MPACDVQGTRGLQILVSSKPPGSRSRYGTYIYGLQSNTDRGCYAGDQCKFLHGETERLTPYDKNKPCKFYAAGYCRRGEKCWFLHADPTKVGKTSEPEEEDENVCTICYDKPETFGLLGEYCHSIYTSQVCGLGRHSIVPCPRFLWLLRRILAGLRMHALLLTFYMHHGFYGY